MNPAGLCPAGFDPIAAATQRSSDVILGRAILVVCSSAAAQCRSVSLILLASASEPEAVRAQVLTCEAVKAWAVSCSLKQRRKTFLLASCQGVGEHSWCRLATF